MKKLFTMLLMLSAACTTQAQVTKAEYDAAWQRQFTLNQNFGANINTLFTNNGDRRKQIEALQTENAALSKRITDLTNLVNTFTNRTVIAEGKIAALEKPKKDTFRVSEGLTLKANTFGTDTAYFNKLYAIKNTEIALLQLALYFDQLDKNNKALDAKLENTVGRLVLLEAFREALKKL